MKRIILIFFLLISSLTFSQELVQGKLLLEDFTTTKISVYNKNSKETVETDWAGIFKMNMNLGDTLVFSHQDVIFDELIIPETVMKSKALRYFLKKEGTKLEELVIDRGPMMNFGTKKLSQTEKRDLQNSIPLVTNNSIGIGLDGIANRISGRNKIIKKIKAYELQERSFNAFKEVYTDELLVNDFEIPKDYINVFIYYIIDEPDFNPDLISLAETFQFYVAQKANKFKKEYER